MSGWLVAHQLPTAGDESTYVLVEHTSAVALRLGEFVGQLSVGELAAVDQPVRLVLELDSSSDTSAVGSLRYRAMITYIAD